MKLASEAHTGALTVVGVAATGPNAMVDEVDGSSFVDEDLYLRDALRGVEGVGVFEARWIDPAQPAGGRPHYPDGLSALLSAQE